MVDEAGRISKARACSECKKHKVRCERKIGQVKCVRCDKHGHKCVVTSHYQKIIEDNTEWKQEATSQTQQLQAAVADLLRACNLPDLTHYGFGTTPSTTSTPKHGHAPPPLAIQQGNGRTSSFNAHMAMTRENSQEPGVDDGELVSAPMGSLFEVTKLRNLRSNLQSSPKSKIDFLATDFISRGVISLEHAERLFGLYNNTLNHFLWGGIALKHRDLNSVRHSSSLLSAAVLAVSALHVPELTDVFDKCFNEYINLVSSSTFDRYHTLDEIRALVIGSFWLSELSWKLSGFAARIATEMNLHQSVQRMLRGKLDHYEKAQLWYLIYVCDHHFSIAYGRPSAIHEDMAMQLSSKFIDSHMATAGDVRLICQVALFQILTRAYNAFGSDVEQELEESQFPLLRAIVLDVEQWRETWERRLADSPVVASYPAKGVVLHYHFAKFQLNSLALRAKSPSAILSMDRREAANQAIHSAMATLDFVLNEPDIRNAIVGVPLFTHTMIAFSAVFLLKVAARYSNSVLGFDAVQVQDLVQRIINLMSSARASEKHLTYHISKGLARMLERLKHLEAGQQLVMVGQPVSGGLNNMLGAIPQDMAYDALDTYDFGFDGTWNEFSMPSAFFPATPYS